MEARHLRIYPSDDDESSPGVSAATPAADDAAPAASVAGNDSAIGVSATDRRAWIRRFHPAALSAGWRRILLATVLAPVFGLIYWGAYLLRFEGELDSTAWFSFQATLLSVVLVKIASFGWFRVYQGWTRYVTFHDLVTLAKAATASALLISMVTYLCFPMATPPRSVFLMDWGLSIVVLGGLRSITRFFEEREALSWPAWGKTSVLIVGTNDSGETLLRAIRRNPKLPYRVAGFIAEDAHAVGTQISGVPVIGTLDQTCILAQRYGVAEVLIAAGELSGRRVRELLGAGRVAGVAVKVLPSYEQLLHGQVGLRPRDVSIEDLLRREPAQLDMHGLHRWIDDRVILVTGSAGSIGSEICRQLLQFAPAKLVLVDRSETGQFFLERELHKLNAAVPLEVCLADLLDKRRMERLFQGHHPHVVFHAAAYKHVPLMEQHPGEGVKNIIRATRQLADLSESCGCDSFVMISTDKAVNPTSVMGACKRTAELYVQALSADSSCRFVTVRFGNVLDSAGSVVPIFRQQIAEGGPVTITHPDMRRYFMTIPEAARLVLQAGAIGRGGHILLLDMGEPVRIVDLAEDMIRLSGLRVDDDIAIEVTGLRPGEKLFEELHLTGEQHLPTSHPKIIVVEHQPSDLHKVVAVIDELEQLADSVPEAIRSRLARAVPEYRRGAAAGSRPARVAA